MRVKNAIPWRRKMLSPYALSVIEIGMIDLYLERRKGICSRRNSMTDNTEEFIPFDVTLLDPDAKAFFERHIRELRAFQQVRRQ
jgi:hypothetical protein